MRNSASAHARPSLPLPEVARRPMALASESSAECAVAGIAVAVDANAATRRRLVAPSSAGRAHRPSSAWLQIDRAWMRCRRLCDILLAQSQADGSASDVLSCADNNEAGDLLGDGVFHLQPRVASMKAIGCIVSIRLHRQELERAGVAIFRRAWRVSVAACKQAIADCGFRPGAGAISKASAARAAGCTHAPTDGHGAGAVAEDLHLDVAGAREQPFDIDVAIAEQFSRLPNGSAHRRRAAHDRSRSACRVRRRRRLP